VPRVDFSFANMSLKHNDVLKADLSLFTEIDVNCTCIYRLILDSPEFCKMGIAKIFAQDNEKRIQGASSTFSTYNPRKTLLGSI
jgi:hypothetical protein